MGLFGIGNLFGSMINAISQDSTNQMNYEIAQMNNEYNKEQFDKQIQYNKEMWNAENEYNTASNQAKRLKEAGINPNIVMSGSNAGVAGSAGGVTPPTASPVTMQAPQFDFSGVDAALAKQADIDIAEQQLQQQQDRINIEYSKAQASIVNLIADANNKDALAEARRIQNTFEIRHQQNRINMDMAQIRSTNVATNRLYWQTLQEEKRLKQMDDVHLAFMAEKSASVAESIARRALIYSNIKVNNANINKIKAETNNIWQTYFRQIEETTGIELDNHIKEKTKDYVIDQAKFLTQRMQNEATPTWYQATSVGNGIKMFWDALAYPLEKASDIVKPFSTK